MLSLDEVNHIAHLARIHLSETEKGKLQKDLSAILDFVKKLNGVDTDNVPPTAQATSLVNAFRNDEAKGEGLTLRRSSGQAAKGKDLLKQVPKREGDFVRVKAVFE